MSNILFPTGYHRNRPGNFNISQQSSIPFQLKIAQGTELEICTFTSTGSLDNLPLDARPHIFIITISYRQQYERVCCEGGGT